jgi:SAM-dependent methyltransferase
VKEIATGYADLAFHRRVAEIIREHSENKEDIRAIARGLIDWPRVRAMLDLGCGYGWFEDGLQERVPHILGIDCLEENEAPFLKRAGSAAEKADFLRASVGSRLPVASDGFDLVVSSYSLYFFPEVIPEVKRVLRPEGIFLVITHSESMLEEGEQFFDFRNLRQIIRGFSAENGEEQLKKYFDHLRYVDYRNALLFKDGSDGALASYINFKKEFISKDVDAELVTRTMLAELRTRGFVRLNKDDRVFVARK